MKKKILPALVLAPVVFLSSCTTTTYTPGYVSTYNPAYTNDYVYSVGYYGYRPYWGNRYYAGYNYYGNRYYSGYRWRNNYWGNRAYRGWGSSRGVYGRGWHGRR